MWPSDLLPYRFVYILNDFIPYIRNAFKHAYSQILYLRFLKI